MANEAQLSCSLTVRILQNGLVDQQFQPQPTSFSADVSQAGGPTPGGFLASTTGTQVVLSALGVQPGLCRIQNLGVSNTGVSLFGTAGQQYTWSNFVEVGLYHPVTQEFLPLLELLPGESYVVRLSRYIGEEFSGTHPGTDPADFSIQMWVKSVGVASRVIVECIPR